VKRDAAVLLVIALAGCDTRSESFKTYLEAKNSGLIEKGWIPPVLPPDATDIRLHWDLDTNISEGSYRSSVLVAPTKAGECEPVPEDPAAIQCETFVFRTEGVRRTFSNRGRTP